VVRDAFRVAMEERPGPVLLELPEDIAGDEVEPTCRMVPIHPIEHSGCASRSDSTMRRRDDPGSEATT
jgi:thiamine pyrophosphate-dependent acetolactate synthase large subunit-like protein